MSLVFFKLRLNDKGVPSKEPFKWLNFSACETLRCVFTKKKFSTSVLPTHVGDKVSEVTLSW